MPGAGSLPSDIEVQVKAQEHALLVAGEKARFDQIREREFYSSYLFPVGLGGVVQAQTYEVFKVLKGLQGQGYNAPLTERETNWLQPGRVPDDQNILIKALHVDIRRGPTDPAVYQSSVLPTSPPSAGHVDLKVPLHPTDLATIARNMVLNVVYLTDAVPYAIIDMVPTVGGVVGFNPAGRQASAAAGASPAFATTIAGGRANLPIARNTCNARFERRLKVPLLLKHGDTFNMSLQVPTAFTLLGANSVTAEGYNGESNDASGCFEVRVGFWAVESFIQHS